MSGGRHVRLKTLGSAIPVLGARTRYEQNRDHDQRRGSARARGYDRTWEKARAHHLAEHPLCFYCAHGVFASARVTAATLIDHVEPHRGDRDLFWLRTNWASCCTDCHAGPKQAVEAKGPEAVAAWIATLPPRPA